mgnify:CR=1 FL=1
MNIDRVIVIVLDGVGVGALPDAADYGDVGSNSVANTARAIGGLDLPNSQARTARWPRFPRAKIPSPATGS